MDKATKITKDQFTKALIALEEAYIECEARNKDSNFYKLVRDAAIQRFEFCVELSWKVSMKFLGISSSSPKFALREMLKAELISDFDLWFDFIEARNNSSHSYDEEIAKSVYAVISIFIVEARKLLSQVS